MIRLIKWMNKEYDIIIDSGTPCEYIENLLKEIKYNRKWICKDNEYIILDSKPLVKEKYKLKYSIKRREDEDVDAFNFTLYLIDKAIDYINNLELVYNSSKED